MANHLTKIKGEKLLYIDDDGTYFLRICEGGVDTNRCLNTKVFGGKDGARAARDAFLLQRTAADLGVGHSPTRKRSTVSAVLDRYEADGHPDKTGTERGDVKHVTEEKRALPLLRAFFTCDTEEIDQDMLDKYRAYRKKNVKAGSNVTGDRTTDLELGCLANACRWALRKKMIRFNPMLGRVKYHKSSKARHAKDVQPVSVDELHEIAAEMFKDKRSEVLGWQLLWEGSTGLRTNEVLLLRRDAEPGQPGHIADGGLCVRPSKQKDANTAAYIELRPDLSLLLKAHQKWLKRRPGQWWFPGRDKTKDQPVGVDSLTHRLEKMFQAKLVKRKITSHGARALFVLIQRSNGVPYQQIAAQLNQIGGVATLILAYGRVPQFWVDGRGPKYTWTPHTLAWKNLGTKPTTGCSKPSSKSEIK